MLAPVAFQSLIGILVNCNASPPAPIKFGSRVSIPNRDFGELQSDGKPEQGASGKFQSLIGILVNCNCTIENIRCMHFCFNP